MNSPKLSDDLRRFIQSIQSIPHLEAILLLRQYSSQPWKPATLAQRLYINPEAAANMLNDLQLAGIFELSTGEAQEYRFKPTSAELSALIDQVADYYAHNLIEVTNMIHSKATQSSRVRQFADAFKFQNKDEQ